MRCHSSLVSRARNQSGYNNMDVRLLTAMA